MDKIFDLIDAGIAVILVVIALSMQLYDNHQVVEMTSMKASKYSLVSVEENHLKYNYNGLELIAHLSLVAEKGQKKLVFKGKEYQYEEFIKNILGVELLLNERQFIVNLEQRQRLESQNYQIYQQNNQTYQINLLIK